MILNIGLMTYFLVRFQVAVDFCRYWKYVENARETATENRNEYNRGGTSGLQN